MSLHDNIYKTKEDHCSHDCDKSENQDPGPEEGTCYHLHSTQMVKTKDHHCPIGQMARRSQMTSILIKQ